MEKKTILERLASNPHYKMSKKQMAKLRQINIKNYLHKTEVKKHDTKLEQE